MQVIWDDAEVRSFYMSLPELRSLVPEVMFIDNPDVPEMCLILLYCVA